MGIRRKYRIHTVRLNPKCIIFYSAIYEKKLITMVKNTIFDVLKGVGDEEVNKRSCAAK